MDYTGFSKKLYSGNEFRLAKQEAVDYQGNYTSAAGGESNLVLGRDSSATKNFYCTKIVIGFFISGVLSTATFSIKDGSSNVKLIVPQSYFLPAGGRTFLLDLDFRVPILFSKGNSIYMNISQTMAAGDMVVWNFYGWEEDVIGN